VCVEYLESCITSGLYAYDVHFGLLIHVLCVQDQVVKNELEVSLDILITRDMVVLRISIHNWMHRARPRPSIPATIRHGLVELVRVEELSRIGDDYASIFLLTELL